MPDIRTQLHNNCLSCGQPGSLLYKDLSDELFGVAGKWDFFHCPACELVWLNPRPIDEDIEKLYASYYTHDAMLKLDNFKDLPLRKKIKYMVLSSWYGYDKVLKLPAIYRFTGKLLGFVPGVKKKVGMRIGWVAPKPGGRFLDVGSGNGDAMVEMKYLGWETYGIEPDKKAVDACTDAGLKVFYGPLALADYPDDFFDLIFMYNVIEHLPDPQAGFLQLKRMLKPGGNLVIWTCSNQSLAHKIFKSSYRGLETSRHFYIFSPKSLQAAAKRAGLAKKRVETYFNEYIWRSSLKLYKHQPNPASPKSDPLTKILLKIASSLWLAISPAKGDDIVAVFSK